MAPVVLHLAHEAATKALGGALALECPRGLVFLRGPLGSGKTTLVRGWLQRLGHGGRVKSPTYTLVEPYPDVGQGIYHWDLYRLADPEELEFAGFRDQLDQGLLLVEWPERGAGWLPEPDLEVALGLVTTGRRAVVTATSDAGRSTLGAVDWRLPGVARASRDGLLPPKH
ncbi:MAG: tRNA (adenosine(37)-N6)-threonylcarbamoyltransferase complex ATPase subunit type 1 TsaE [Candidatus Competibacterales bacterium]